MQIIISFLTIFIFVTIDNVISPLVGVFHTFYNIPMPEVLQLISSCTLGIVIGTFCGPLLLNRWKIFKSYLLAVLSFGVFLALFVSIKSFPIALIMRFFLGLSSGLFASCFWWITYHGLDTQKGKDAMISVMLAGRPVAISLGVPALVSTVLYLNWQWGFLIYGVLLVIINLPFLSQLKLIEKDRFFANNSANLLDDYQKAFKTPLFVPLFMSLFLTSLAYFGFYSISGLWFMKLFHKDTSFLSQIFLFIGFGEVVATFLAPLLIRKVPFNVLFHTTVLISIITYAVFALAIPFLWPTLLSIMLFLLLNRVYTFIFMRKIPEIFRHHPNKSAIASLSTLVSWSAFAVISYIQSYVALWLELRTIGLFMLSLLTLGLLIMEKTLKRPVC